MIKAVMRYADFVASKQSPEHFLKTIIAWAIIVFPLVFLNLAEGWFWLLAVVWYLLFMAFCYSAGWPEEGQRSHGWGVRKQN